jgi:hypothetical protein
MKRNDLNNKWLVNNKKDNNKKDNNKKVNKLIN